MDPLHFVCLNCGAEFDTGPEPMPCPECGSTNTYLIKPCLDQNIPIYSGPGDCQNGDSRWEKIAGQE